MKFREENQAMANLQQWDKKSFMWATFTCSKILQLFNTAVPKISAHAYFNGAKGSGYTQMFINSEDEDIRYPKEGPCSVEELQKRYNEEGQMVDGDHKISTWGKAWYFCKPKKPSSLPICAIL